MDYRRFGNTYLVRMDVGEEIIEQLKSLCRSENIRLAQVDAIGAVRQAIIDIRQSKLPDPKILGNGGSFFVNPMVPVEKYRELAAKYPGMPHYEVDAERVKIPAGWLIEQCGWKGRSQGRVGVYEKQALVLVNLGGATGQEVLDLCRQIQHDVKQKFGVEIKPEVNVI